MISVLINTRNEDRWIELTIASVSAWADEVVVVDMESSDETVAIAERMGARVHSHPNVGFVEPAREFGVSVCQGDWVLVLDADEFPTNALLNRLREVSEKDQADVVDVAMETWIFGAPIQVAGWNPETERHPRFFKRGSIAFSSKIHSSPSIESGARRIASDFGNGEFLRHFNYLDPHHFIEKLNRYTTIEAQDWIAVPSRRASGLGCLKMCLEEFRLRFFYQGGWRGGWRGWTLSILMSFYRFLVWAKVRSHRSSGNSDQIFESYKVHAASASQAHGGNLGT